jgi:phosphoribosylaminoimidazolecarboxamide formyltransferase/IMP cyclohydrolase
MANKKIKSALISVFHKEGLDVVAKALHRNNVTIYSTGGTAAFLRGLDIPVVDVEDVTDYPSIFGGRVKTLHPKIFGGILYRRDNESDLKEKEEHNIPEIDLTVVDLYPFVETVKNSSDEAEIIEKIDIGGISLIRAAAKNFKDSAIISTMELYGEFVNRYEANNGGLTLEDRRFFATEAFKTSMEYDTAIHVYFSGKKTKDLRYGENPHQSAQFQGDLDAMFEKLHGKELSYNNLLDVDAAVNLIQEFNPNLGVSFAILKHNNACGFAIRPTAKQAYVDALAGDPQSAFGGILICNSKIDEAAANEISSLFCEVVIAPSFTSDALEILKKKKNRVLLIWKKAPMETKMVRTILNGVLIQEKDETMEFTKDYTSVTNKVPTDQEMKDLEIALAMVKNTKSNAIVLVKDGQLLASGTGQTSRVDALNQAIDKANKFGFDLNGSVMASDAFFPFPDCVEIASKVGVKAVVQPGGSKNDNLSIDYCNGNEMAMVCTGVRHFKH